MFIGTYLVFPLLLNVNDEQNKSLTSKKSGISCLVCHPGLSGVMVTSKALLGNVKISECRVQGDPLGPLLFALALQSLLKPLAEGRQGGGLDLVFSYLEDCRLAGEASEVAAASHTLGSFASICRPQMCSPRIESK